MKLTCLLVVAASSVLLWAENAIASDNKAKTSKGTSKKVLTGYFPNWLYESYRPSDIDFSAYTHINYAFANLVNTTLSTWGDPSVFNATADYSFPTLVKLADAAGAKVMISNGGWAGGTKFSSMVASPSARKNFIEWNVGYVSEYNLAGVDLDWEYPNNPGPGCNEYSPEDVPNFLLLIKELRQALDKAFPKEHKDITLAVFATPWGPKQEEKDVSAFVPYVDRFNLMIFDLNLPTDPMTAPNAPFKTEPGKGYQYGFVESVEFWHLAGVPYEKIVAGVSFYGRARTVTVSKDPTTQYIPAATPYRALGDSDDGPWTNLYCPTDSFPSSGTWKYKNLRSQGVLSTPTTAAEPWIRHFDNVTQTPWLYNPRDKVYISYDDPVSIGVKTQWAIDKGLAGMFCWSVEEDNGELLDAMRPLIKG
ncbi:glycoside hydrolase superfamily, partial [Parasitella parasitica]